MDQGTVVLHRLLSPDSKPSTKIGTWATSAVNGAVSAVEALELAGDPHPFHQPNQLLRNLGDATFVEVTARAGEVFELSEVRLNLGARTLELAKRPSSGTS